MFAKVILLVRYTGTVSLRVCLLSESLRLIYSDLLELSTLSHSKYKWVITFLDNYSFYYNIAFYTKSLNVVTTTRHKVQ